MSKVLKPAICTDLGANVPSTDHAISVSLPTWKANVGYEEGEDWVLSKMKNGYPRFFINLKIQAFARELAAKYGQTGDQAMLFPSTSTAQECVNFLRGPTETPLNHVENDGTNNAEDVRAFDLVLQKHSTTASALAAASTMLSVVMYPESYAKQAKVFWQHTGTGVTSRRAEFFQKVFDEGLLVQRQHVVERSFATQTPAKGPRRYQKDNVLDAASSPTKDKSMSLNAQDKLDYLQFIEERFGRNLDLTLAGQAKLAIKRRIAAPLTCDLQSKDGSNGTANHTLERATKGLTEDDVFLYPMGMTAIFESHKMLRKIRGPMKSIMFGFPYIDTLKILEKFGAGAVFYGHGSEHDLDDIEQRCQRGEQFLALYCEFPGNPLLKTPNLKRIFSLSRAWGFPIVVDETIGNFRNVDVLPAADVIVSSLTKVFSGDSNVMGGSLTINPEGKWYRYLKATLQTEYEDNMWPEDAVFLERNSRDFISRNDRINANAEAVCEVLRKSPIIKALYYPKFAESKANYDAFKYPTGGYGGLASVTFHSIQDAEVFYDSLLTEKGPSLGTNFTLSSPFVILAHYNEMDWAALYGADATLVRMSIGLEDTQKLCSAFQDALQAVEQCRST